MTNILKIMLAAALVLPAWVGAQVTTNYFQQSRYAAQYADYNGDGFQDVLLKPAKIIVPIPLDDDLVIPVPVNSKAPVLLLRSTGLNIYELLVNPTESTYASVTWQPASYAITYPDLLANGIGSVTLFPSQNGLPGFSIGKSSVAAFPILLQVLNLDATGLNLRAANLSFATSDKTADGRDDMVITSNDTLVGVMTADATGKLILNDALSIKLVWYDFVKALRASNQALAKSYLSTTAATTYAALFASASELPGLATGFADFYLDVIENRGATGVLVRKIGGEDFLHIVYFIKQDDGWKVNAL